MTFLAQLKLFRTGSRVVHKCAYAGLVCENPSSTSSVCACGGKLKFVALIEKPDVLEKIFSHIGLIPPPLAPVRREELFKAASRAGVGRLRLGPSGE